MPNPTRSLVTFAALLALTGQALALGPGLPSPARPLIAPGSAQAQVGPHLANGIAAVVEDRIITLDEVQREIALLIPQLQRDSRNEAEFQQNVRALWDEVVNSLVDRVLIVKNFKKDGAQIPRSYLETELKELIRQDFNGDRGRFLQYLNSQGISVRDFRRDLEERIIVQYMRGQMRRSESIVSPEKMELFYEEKKHTFYQDEAVHLRIIQLTPLTNESDDILLQTAETIERRLQEGESFSDLARRYSQDRRRREGGSWGWIKTDELREDWSEIVAALKPGQASDPITSREGIFILYVEDYRPAGIQPIHQVRDQIETILASQMAREAQTRWLERLRQNAYVRFYL
jgi:peptidyl-prolyl cis-trans isomerase SurA